MKKISLLLLIFKLTSCTVVRVAPTPSYNGIDFVESKDLKGRQINALFRNSSKMSPESYNIYKKVVTEQLKRLGAEISEHSKDSILFEVNRYGIDKFEIGCTIGLATTVSFNGSVKAKEFGAYDKQIYCPNKGNQKKMAENVFSMYLLKLSSLLR